MTKSKELHHRFKREFLDNGIIQYHYDDGNEYDIVCYYSPVMGFGINGRWNSDHSGYTHYSLSLFIAPEENIVNDGEEFGKTEIFNPTPDNIQVIDDHIDIFCDALDFRSLFAGPEHPAEHSEHCMNLFSVGRVVFYTEILFTSMAAAQEYIDTFRPENALPDKQCFSIRFAQPDRTITVAHKAMLLTERFSGLVQSVTECWKGTPTWSVLK